MVDDNFLHFWKNKDLICKMCNVEIELIAETPTEKDKYVEIRGKDYSVFIPVGKNKQDISKQIDKLKFEIERSENILGNIGFTTKAPKELVSAERVKLAKNKEMLNILLEDKNDKLE